MVTRLHVGSSELRGEVAAYAKRFDLLEVRGLDAPNLKRAPNTSTLRRWRKNVPPQFEFAVVAGANVGKLKPSEHFEVELEAMMSTAKILEARILVLPTPPDVTPSKLWRDRFAKVLERIPHDVTTVVWEPSGLWEVDDAAVQAKKWGVVLAVDPARDIMPVGPIAFGRLRALGGTRAYSTSALEKIARAIGDRRDAYVILETKSALKEGKALRRLLRSVGSKKTGGLTRLVRPRGTPLDFRADDEQE